MFFTSLLSFSATAQIVYHVVSSLSTTFFIFFKSFFDYSFSIWLKLAIFINNLSKTHKRYFRSYVVLFVTYQRQLAYNTTYIYISQYFLSPSFTQFYPQPQKSYNKASKSSSSRSVFCSHKESSRRELSLWEQKRLIQNNPN